MPSAGLLRCREVRRGRRGRRGSGAKVTAAGRGWLSVMDFYDGS